MDADADTDEPKTRPTGEHCRLLEDSNIATARQVDATETTTPLVVAPEKHQQPASRKRSQCSVQMSRCSAGGSSSGRGSTLADSRRLERSSSRSMLDLDAALGGKAAKFCVTWTDLSYSYQATCCSDLFSRNNNKSKLVLRNLSGGFQSNQLVAVIGPSGCGKTTLLQFLAGNKKSQSMRVFGLDEPKVAFIGQDDSLLAELTARETLLFASRLQNKQPNFDHSKHIEPITRELGLSECIDRKVNKLSGGQLKRVTIGQELLYPTNLLILDEITSGLDASTSYAIVRLLKQLASDTCYPMSIVMSIHQPSARLFSVFDRVYLMSEGSCLYEGSCDAQHVNTHLARFGLECPKYHNIADYLIEIASNDLAGLSSDKGELIRQQLIDCQHQAGGGGDKTPTDEQQLSDKTTTTTPTPTIQVGKTAASSLAGSLADFSSCDNVTKSAARCCHESLEMLPTTTTTMTAKTTTITMTPDNSDTSTTSADSQPNSRCLFDAVGSARSRRARPFFGHLAVHLSRSMARISRSYVLTYLQLLSYIALGVQLATFYKSDIGQLSGCPRLPMSFIGFVLESDTELAKDNPTDEMRRIQENMNLLLIAVMTCTFAALEITVLTFPLEAKTVKREWRNGWYRVTSYFFGRTLADLPFTVVFVAIFCSIIYSMTSQIGLLTWRFGYFMLIMVLVALVAQSVGFIFGALFMHDLSSAVFMAPLCIFPGLLFSGFFVRASQVPPVYRFLTQFSHFKYAFDALLVTLYGYDRCHCDQSLLDQYHESLRNQTDTMGSIVRNMFGGAGNKCPSGLQANAPTSETENTIGDATSGLLASGTQSMKPFEDALVDRLFAHMSNFTTNSTEQPLASLTGTTLTTTTTTALPVAAQTTTEAPGTGPMDQVMSSFTTKITEMFNSRSNFGRQVPTRCENFNSYLMAEFELNNNDLITGIACLFIAVICTRILCNIVLNFTIATRSR